MLLCYSRQKLVYSLITWGRVAVLSDRCEPENVIPAFWAGANVHFARNVGCGAFVKALELVMLGQTILPQELLTFVGDRDMEHGHRPIVHEPEGLPPAAPSTAINDTPRLSFREKSVLGCIVEGSSNKCIARKINNRGSDSKGPCQVGSS